MGCPGFWSLGSPLVSIFGHVCGTDLDLFAILNFFLFTSAGTQSNKGRQVTIKFKQRQEIGICHMDEFQQA